MPKVMPEYLENRRRQILDAALDCFSRNGFHQTSMQDICRAAGLSPGALYRYFRSKEEIITACCAESNDQDLRMVEAIKQRGDTLEVLAELAHEFFGKLRPDEIALMLALWAESARTESIRETLRGGAAGFRESFAEIVRHAQGRHEINPGLKAEAVATVLCSMYLGFIVQRNLDAEFSLEDYIDAAMAMASGNFWLGAPRAVPPIPFAAVH